MNTPSQTNKVFAEMLRFLLVGGIAVIIDGISYFLLTRFQILDHSWAKRVSFLLGAVWAFFMNKFFTFRKKAFRKSEPVLFTLVYVVGFLLNSMTHDVVISLWGIPVLAFLLATALSTISNFLGQKLAVFRA